MAFLTLPQHGINSQTDQELRSGQNYAQSQTGFNRNQRHQILISPTKFSKQKFRSFKITHNHQTCSTEALPRLPLYLKTAPGHTRICFDIYNSFGSAQQRQIVQNSLIGWKLYYIFKISGKNIRNIFVSEDTPSANMIA